MSSGRLICLLLLLPLMASGRRGQNSQAVGTTGSTSADSPADWPMVGRDPGGDRYSALTQVTPENVRDLKVALIYHMKPVAKTDASHPAHGGSPPSGAGFHQSEDQPLVIGQTMYVVTPSQSCG